MKSDSGWEFKEKEQKYKPLTEEEKTERIARYKQISEEIRKNPDPERSELIAIPHPVRVFGIPEPTDYWLLELSNKLSKNKDAFKDRNFELYEVKLLWHNSYADFEMEFDLELAKIYDDRMPRVIQKGGVLIHAWGMASLGKVEEIVTVERKISDDVEDYLNVNEHIENYLLLRETKITSKKTNVFRIDREPRIMTPKESMIKDRNDTIECTLSQLKGN